MWAWLAEEPGPVLKTLAGVRQHGAVGRRTGLISQLHCCGHMSCLARVLPAAQGPGGAQGRAGRWSGIPGWGCAQRHGLAHAPPQWVCRARGFWGRGLWGPDGWIAPCQSHPPGGTLVGLALSEMLLPGGVGTWGGGSQVPRAQPGPKGRSRELTPSSSRGPLHGLLSCVCRQYLEGWVRWSR